MTADTKVVLVTGASSGLGRAIALRFGSAGWTVGLVARRRERLEALAAEIRSSGGDARVLVGDLGDGEFASRVVDALVATTGRLDVLVNNAGAPTPPGPEEVSDAQFDQAFVVNVRSIYRLSHRALPHLQATRGSIVNISSAGVARNIPFDLVYLTTKGAVEVLSRGMAKRWGPLGVRVNDVAPGMVLTEILEVAGRTPEAAREEVASFAARMQPHPHAGQPDDIAEAVMFLASEAAAFVTGATLHVDGGLGLGG